MNMKKTIAAVAAASVAVSAMATTVSALEDQTYTFNLVKEVGQTSEYVNSAVVTASFSNVKLVAGGKVVIYTPYAAAAHGNSTVTITGNYNDNTSITFSPITTKSLEGEKLWVEYTDTFDSPSKTYKAVEIPVVSTTNGTGVSLFGDSVATINVTWKYDYLSKTDFGWDGAVTADKLGLALVSINGSNPYTYGDPASVDVTYGGTAGLTITDAKKADIEAKLAAGATASTPTINAGDTVTFTYKMQDDGAASAVVGTNAGNATASIGGGAGKQYSTSDAVTLAATTVSAEDWKALVTESSSNAAITYTSATGEITIAASAADTATSWTVNSAAPSATVAKLLPTVNNAGSGGTALDITITVQSPTCAWDNGGNAVLAVADLGTVGGTPAEDDTITVTLNSVTTSSEETVAPGGKLYASREQVLRGTPANNPNPGDPDTRVFVNWKGECVDFGYGGQEVYTAPYLTNMYTNAAGAVDIYTATGRNGYNNIIYYLEHEPVNVNASKAARTLVGGINNGPYTNVAAVINDAAQNYDVTFRFNSAKGGAICYNACVANEYVYCKKPDDHANEGHYGVFGQHLYPLYDNSWDNKGEVTGNVGLDWAGLNLFNSALVVNGDFTMSLSDTDAFVWNKDSVEFDWDSIVNAAANKGITNPYALWIHSLSLVTSTGWFWDSMDLVLAVKDADDASADAGVDSDDEEIGDDEAEFDDEDDADDFDDTDDFGGDDEDEDDGDDEDDFDAGNDNEDAGDTQVEDNPKTGNASVALAVIPVALAAAAVVAKKRS